MDKHNFKKGDFVSVIDNNIQGEIISVHGNRITIKDSDGFPYYCNANQIILRKPLNVIIPKEIEKDKTSINIKAIKKHKKPKFLEVDLHIHQITYSVKNMTNHQMLQYQISYAKQKIEYAIINRIPKVILIHGKGKGVLKKELIKMLKDYPAEIKDASYQKYGFGALEVFIYLSRF
jgi:dsDNA-specific endonuclease/ATPase MutS2